MLAHLNLPNPPPSSLIDIKEKTIWMCPLQPFRVKDYTCTKLDKGDVKNMLLDIIDTLHG
jgi:hypothetical protein